MSYGFLTDLVVEKLSEGDSNGRATWMLREALEYRSQLIGMVIVPAGFTTDFASVPRAPLAYWLTGDTAHGSAVVHDYLCRVLVPLGRITWSRAADVFGEAMKHEGVPAWRRWLMRMAVVGADPANRVQTDA